MNIIAAICIGVACRVLEPRQPRSFVAAALLITAIHLYLLSN